MEGEPDSNQQEEASNLLQAAREGNIDRVRSILQRHSKSLLNCINEIGQTPLHLASRNQHLNIVKELILNGANINALDKQCRSPLHAAVSLDLCMGSEENLQVVQYLVDHGADLTIQDSEGFTPIHHASKSGRVHILKWIMDHDSFGYLPPSYSRQKKLNSDEPPDDDCKGTCMRVVKYMWSGYAYPILEMTASVVCCLPAWQACTEQSPQSG